MAGLFFQSLISPTTSRLLFLVTVPMSKTAAKRARPKSPTATTAMIATFQLIDWRLAEYSAGYAGGGNERPLRLALVTGGASASFATGIDGLLMQLLLS